MARPTGESRRASFVALSPRVRSRNLSDAFLGEGWSRSDLPVWQSRCRDRQEFPRRLGNASSGSWQPSHRAAEEIHCTDWSRGCASRIAKERFTRCHSSGSRRCVRRFRKGFGEWSYWECGTWRLRRVQARPSGCEPLHADGRKTSGQSGHGAHMCVPLWWAV